MPGPWTEEGAGAGEGPLPIPLRYLAPLLALALAGAVLVGACGDDPTVPDDAPEGHTIVRDGAAHAPGFRSPEANCTSCHGDDLRGGPQGEPSCFACHGEVW